MTTYPRLRALATARPPHEFGQREMAGLACEGLFGPDWAERPELAGQIQRVHRLFEASRVECRQSVVDLPTFYRARPGIGTRMEEYRRSSYTLGREALERCLDSLNANGSARDAAHDVTDFVVVSCTGYSAPGLDILLARDLEMPRDVRRVQVGHMGCYGAMTGLRQAQNAVLARPGATAALLSVELTTLHFMSTDDVEVLTSFALFGDAAGALLLTTADDGDTATSGPELLETYCAADFSGADQMRWDITDQAFMMGLSPRVPVTLRRNVAGVVEHLLAPHGLTPRDVAHWVVHPGGPSILDVVAAKLELSADQMRHSWDTLRECGNCSSATVLLILERLLQSGDTRPGDYGVMMAFGPGLTLETCLLRF